MINGTSIDTQIMSSQVERARAQQKDPAKSAEALINSTNGDPAKIRKVAEDFEAVFLGQMLQHMWAGIETDPQFGGGHGEDMFRPMMIDEFGKKIAANGGLGIADQLEAQLLQLQEVK
jgi:Rod binding domain-containing protein